MWAGIGWNQDESEADGISLWPVISVRYVRVHRKGWRYWRHWDWGRNQNESRSWEGLWSENSDWKCKLSTDDVLIGLRGKDCDLTGGCTCVLSRTKQTVHTCWTPASGGCDGTVGGGMFLLSAPRFGKLLCGTESWGTETHRPRALSQLFTPRAFRQETSPSWADNWPTGRDHPEVPRLRAGAWNPWVTEGIKFTEKQGRGLYQGV